MSEFVIHALPMTGGILALAPLPGRGGSYAEDLTHLRDWQPALVISLTSLAEMEAEGVAHLGADIQGMGTRWAHLPIKDFGVPELAIEILWPATSTAARAALDGGGRVLIHCRGGCGRSGMVALRLMIEGGEAPQSALTRLRGVRPCAVETEAQMDWAMGKRA